MKSRITLIQYSLLLLTLLSTPTFAWAQKSSDAHIIGHVVDRKTGEHLPFASIRIAETGTGSMTDASGHFIFKNLPEGSYTFEVSFIGYLPEKRKIQVVRQKTIEEHFQLEPDNTVLDEVVVTSNRTESKRRESSAIVNVVSSKLFERTASNTLSDVLNYQPGMRVEQSCSNCGVPQLRINGLEGQYSQILLDSRPIFSSLSNVYGLEQLPASMIERVEVIRGGGSALFGSNAIAGVVNIITKEPISNTFTLSNRTQYMGNGAWDTNTSLNGSLVTEDYRSGLYLFSMVRDRSAYDRDGDGFSDLPQLKGTTVGMRAYHRLTSLSKITLEYHHMEEYRRGGNALDRPPHEADLAEQLRHRIDGGGIKYDLSSSDQKHRMNLYSSAQYIDRDSYFGTHKNADAYGATNDLTVVGGGQYTWDIDKFLFMPAQLVAGLEANYNRLDDKHLGHNRQLLQTAFTYGGYLQNEWRNRHWSILLGGRLEKHNLLRAPIFSPRANVRYSPNHDWNFRLSYAQGYRAPQAYEEDLHVAAVGGEVSFIELDPNLRPEFSNSLSGSVEWSKRLDGWGQISLLAEGFYTMLNDLFVLVQNGHDDKGNLLFLRKNARGATVGGVNLEARLDHYKYFSIQAGMTLQRSRYRDPLKWSEDTTVEPINQMFRSPDMYGFVSASYTPTKQLAFSTSLAVSGTMLVPHYAGYIERDQVTKTQTFAEWGIKGSYRIPVSKAVQLEIELGIKNLLDHFQTDLDRGVMRDAKYIYGPSAPRTYYAGVKFLL